MFGGFAAEKLKRLQVELEPLSRRYDVVVANPPYMGSSNMNSWLSGWTKKRHREVCKDLCTCFIKRGFSLSDDRGYEALITSDTCMYISSFEKMRKEVIEQTSIVCFIDTRGTNAHPDVFDANAGWVLWNHAGANIKGSYFKLNHSIPEKGQRLLEALANPDCGWFYRADASGFEAIPGSPIAYWASKTALDAFSNSDSFSDFVTPKSGFSTGDNDKFIHFWWELNWQSFCIDCASLPEANLKTEYWFPLNKGGGFRKWYGNNLFAVNWKNNAFEMKKCSGYRSGCERYYFHKGLTWGTISSSLLSVRYSPIGYMPNRKGAMAFSDIDANLYYGLGLLNSSTAMYYLRFLAPTLDFSEGPVGALPFIKADRNSASVIAQEAIGISQRDYDSFEESWDFRRHPLI
ncbi:Eco57I restriction-modification methylase domain-containing protein [Senegalimassilia anaerobia]|uniref:Eco57I restriction-modification methylase domain-containing protein n=1 Tax=Senegalimassilia anaerobia TaxID=1473216 RepID=UPI003A8ED8CD